MPYKNLKYKGQKYQHVKHFKNKTAYKKYVAHIAIHKIPHKHHATVIVGGKVYHPK